MGIKTSELTGTALDWAVAKCEAVKLHPMPQNGVMEIHFSQPNGGNSFSPSTDWAQGGPIIEGYGIELALIANHWKAAIAFSGKEVQRGPTPLIAAMRCYVASKLGDEVEVPKELE
jgi:hypothetical protein